MAAATALAPGALGRPGTISAAVTAQGDAKLGSDAMGARGEKGKGVDQKPSSCAKSVQSRMSAG